MDTFILYKDNKILVSPEHFEELSKYNWVIRNDNYVTCRINGKQWYLHRYIMINLLGNNIGKNYTDHINNNRLDNRIANLRELSPSDNSRNRLKKKNTTSSYFGVCFNKLTKKWDVSLTVDKKKIVYEFESEIHAAYQYDILIKKYNLNSVSKMNNIEIPHDFIEGTQFQRKCNLPKGISYNGSKLQVKLQLNKYRRVLIQTNDIDNSIKIRDTLSHSKNIFYKILIELKSMFNNKKNKDGNYIFIIKNTEIIIDKEMYQLMLSNTWHISRHYVINSKKQSLSRLVLKCTEPELVVDHINGNTYDNRKCNLRVVTKAQNSMNCPSNKNSVSKYLGVTKYKERWTAGIFVNGKRLYLGLFDREVDAALARDFATKKYFKEFGRLNFPERPGWDEYFMKICEAVKLRSPDHYQVGSVLVSLKNNRIISTGYNSSPPGLDDDKINWSDRNSVRQIVTHSEMNVLLYANNCYEDSILYTTTSPCVNCLKHLASSKIKKIIYKHEYKDIDDVKSLCVFYRIELQEYVNIR